MSVESTAGRVLVCAAFGAVLAVWPGRVQAEDQGLSKGTLELSTAASFSSFKSEGSDDSVTVINLPARLGIFATRNLSGEAELALTRVSYDGRSSTAVVGSGSALWHFQPAARTVPFLIAGAGIGNGFDYLGTLTKIEGTTIKTLHAGAGIKARVGDSAAFRIEYRFTHAMGSGGEFDDENTSFNTHRVFIGISLFTH
jgi:opacity protein-like surface antigen